MLADCVASLKTPGDKFPALQSPSQCSTTQHASRAATAPRFENLSDRSCCAHDVGLARRQSSTNPFLQIRDPPELSNPLSALRTSNFLIKIFLGDRTLTECSDFSRALTRHRIGHSGGNIPLIQRDLIEVYAPSRLNYPLGEQSVPFRNPPGGRDRRPLFQAKMARA